MADKEKEEKQKESDVPEALQDKKIETEVKTFKKVVEDKLLQLKDMATLEIMMDVTARMRERLRSLKEMSSAKSYKIQGHWKTNSPKMHIRSLIGKKMNNEEAKITFGVYATDDKGNKQIFENKAKEETESGRVIEKVRSVDYRIAFEVTETIKMGKPIHRTIMKFDME